MRRTEMSYPGSSAMKQDLPESQDRAMKTEASREILRAEDGPQDDRPKRLHKITSERA